MKLTKKQLLTALTCFALAVAAAAFSGTTARADNAVGYNYSVTHAGTCCGNDSFFLYEAAQGSTHKFVVKPYRDDDKTKYTIKLVPEPADSVKIKYGKDKHSASITFKKPGPCVISVNVYKKGTNKLLGKGSEITTQITEKAAADPAGRIKSIKLKAAKSVKAGKSLKIKATVKTTGSGADKTLKWTSSNKKYASVTSKGVVKAKKAGKGKTVKITASAADGSGKKASVKIKIK